jgi:uncharacterized membrane protein
MTERPEPSGWSDRQVETIVGNLLRTGVLVAAAIVLCGGLIYVARHGAATPDYRLFRGEPTDLCSPPGIVADAFQGNSRGIIQLGFLVLIATPVLRVAACSIAFACQRDRLYVVVSLIVLVLLLYSLLVGSLL